MAITAVNNTISTKAQSQNWENWKSSSVNGTPISTEGLIRPNEARGRLVNDPIVPSPKRIFKGISYQAKALKDGFTGKANDHQLGKLNDVGMKVGGLALAGYLATQKATPKTKLMEFVGLGTFLAAMNLWPKIAIAAPAKAIHGFNPMQKYEDSFGREKAYFQDAQYTPTDLYSNEKLQKIGDRMGIDKNINDRNDATMKQMKKVATQNNTLWMLTAGIASAVFSALACNQAEKVIDPALEKANNKKADNMLANFDEACKKQENNKMIEALNKVFADNKDKAIDNKMVEKITSIMTKGMDPITNDGVKADLTNMLLGDNKTVVDEKLADSIISGSKKVLAERFSEEEMAKILPNKEEMVESFKASNFMGREIAGEELKDLRTVVTSSYISKAKSNGLSKDDLKHIKSTVSASADETFAASSSAKLNDAKIEKLTEIAQVMNKYQAKTKVLDDYAQLKVADKPDSVIAAYWNSVSGSLIKTMGIDYKELEKVRNNREMVQELVRGKMEEITSDDAKYETAIKAVASKVAELDQKIRPEDTKKYSEKVVKVYDDFATEMAQKGMNETANKLTAYNVGGKGSLKRVKQVYFEERIAGVKNSFSRLINTMDTYRRVSTGKFSPEMNGMSREIKEGLIELTKQTTLQGHSSDHSIKFYFNRNQNPNPDTSEVEIKDGKVVNKYFDKSKGVDIPADYDFYQKAMNFMYKQDFDPITKKALQESKMEDQVRGYMNDVHKNIGGADYFTKPNHKTGADQNASSEYKFLLLGVAPDEMFTKTIQQTYNTQKWGKTFGTAGAILTGLTVAAQFLFGKGKKV